MKSIIVAWSLLKWLSRARKNVGPNTAAYFTKERALRWRFQGEKWARAVADGKLDGLPTPIKWVFALTGADEALAKFFQYFLKSEKLKTKDKSLYNPFTGESQ